MVLALSHLTQLWGDPFSSGQSESNLDIPVGPICTDSRKFSEGCFYVPLQGQNFDGHNFLPQVVELGAQAAVVARASKIKIPSGLIYWIVDDTLHAYQQLGFLHRTHLNIPVVAVTGSTGKTTTRELIKASLGSLGNIVASADNNNNEVGVPLTLLKADSFDKAIVVEMGMRGLGQIEQLSKYTQPDIAVITNIGSAHIGLLGSRRNIAKAKCEITSSLKPTGLVVVPAGDSLLEKELSKIWKGRVLRVSLEEEGSDQPLNEKDSPLLNLPKPDIKGNVLLGKGQLLLEGIEYNLPLEGRHNAINFLLAIAVARELGVDASTLKQLNVSLPLGRQTFVKLGDITFIDETYNASPEAVHASLNLLASRSGRHFAVLGKMLELGEHSVALHREIAEYALRLGLDGLVIVADGAEAEAMAAAAISIKFLAITSSPEEALNPLLEWLRPGDFVLLKASRGIALERLLPLFADAQS